MDKIYQAIATAWQAKKNCEQSGNDDWLDKWESRLDELEQLLPSGSGFDAGTSINREKTTAGKIVLDTSYHHMNEVGMYDGWTEHAVIVTPAWQGFNLRVTGINKNGVKEYLEDTFHWALLLEAPDFSSTW